jgi:transcriptional pleiotropic regulator of transition state genes
MAVHQFNNAEPDASHRDGMSVRHVDVLGRVVIPIDMRRQAGFEAGDEVAVRFVDGDILISKVAASCAACGCGEPLIEFRHAHLCRRCRDELRDS